jgi:hypothetical protein
MCVFSLGGHLSSRAHVSPCMEVHRQGEQLEGLIAACVSPTPTHLCSLSA